MKRTTLEKCVATLSDEWDDVLEHEVVVPEPIRVKALAGRGADAGLRGTRRAVGSDAGRRLRRLGLGEQRRREVALAGVAQDGDDQLALVLGPRADLGRGGGGRRSEMPTRMPSCGERARRLEGLARW